MADIQLISNILCPFTQRAGIQFAEKGVDFERIYIDLADKPDWFTAISPLGKVPVLRVGDEAVFETSVICNFIEDAYPDKPLLPEDALNRAAERGWCEFISAMIGDVYMFYTAGDEQACRGKGRDIAVKMGWLARHVGDGPWFGGERFSLVDAAIAPVFRLFDGFDRIADFGLMEQAENLKEWRVRLSDRRSVKGSVVAEYGEQFIRYLAGQKSWLATQVRL